MLLLLAACVAEPERSDVQQQNIRLDMPDVAVKVVVLGSGLTAEQPQQAQSTPEPERRLPASIALVAPDGAGLFVVDPSVAVERQLDALAGIPELEGRESPRLVDGILVTRPDPATIAGIGVLARSAASGTIALYGTRRMLDSLWPRLPAGPPGGWDLRELTEGEELALCAGLSVTALPLPSPGREGRLPAVAYRFDGAQRSLLYLPRGDPFSDLHAAVAAWCPTIDVALLDGSSVRFDGEARRDWTIDSFLGEIDALRAGGDGRMVVLFTRLSVRNPFHHPAGELRERLRAHRADLAQDGTQFWL